MYLNSAASPCFCKNFLILWKVRRCFFGQSFGGIFLRGPICVPSGRVRPWCHCCIIRRGEIEWLKVMRQLTSYSWIIIIQSPIKNFIGSVSDRRGLSVLHLCRDCLELLFNWIASSDCLPFASYPTVPQDWSSTHWTWYLSLPQAVVDSRMWQCEMELRCVSTNRNTHHLPRHEISYLQPLLLIN